MLNDDVEMLMCHCRNSLSANGELLGAMTRIKTALAEGQKPPTNSAMDAISALRDLVGMIDGFLKWRADVHLSEGGQSKLDRAKDVLKLHQ